MRWAKTTKHGSSAKALRLKRTLARRGSGEDGFFLFFPEKLPSNFSQSRKASSAFDRPDSLCAVGMVRSYDFGSPDAIGGERRAW